MAREVQPGHGFWIKSNYNYDNTSQVCYCSVCGMPNPKPLGKLFDGIGGFIIAFQHAGATCRFTAEIEDYPRAVVKYHFGGEDVEETTDEE